MALLGHLLGGHHGFSVQVAHKVGAKDFESARDVLRQSIVACLAFSGVVMAVGMAISSLLPYWLGGTETISPQASLYFFVFIAALPLLTMNYLAGGMLRCVGNIKVPSLLNVMMCVMDCLFNFLLIFPTRDIDICGININMPGAGLGVLGAALGTVIAEADHGNAHAILGVLPTTGTAVARTPRKLQAAYRRDEKGGKDLRADDR